MRMLSCGALAALLACSGQAGIDPGRDALLETRPWVLTALKETPVPSDPLRHITLYVNAGNASGSAGCNSYSAQFLLKPPSHVAVDAVAATKVMCGDAQLMDLELSYLSALRGVVSYRVDESRLDLLDGNGRVQLSYIATAAR